MTAGVLIQIYGFKFLNPDVLIVNFEEVTHIAAVIILLNLNKSMSSGRVFLIFSN